MTTEERLENLEWDLAAAKRRNLQLLAGVGLAAGLALIVGICALRSAGRKPPPQPRQAAAPKAAPIPPAPKATPIQEEVKKAVRAEFEERFARAEKRLGKLEAAPKAAPIQTVAPSAASPIPVAPAATPQPDWQKFAAQGETELKERVAKFAQLQTKNPPEKLAGLINEELDRLSKNPKTYWPTFWPEPGRGGVLRCRCIVYYAGPQTGQAKYLIPGWDSVDETPGIHVLQVLEDGSLRCQLVLGGHRQRGPGDDPNPKSREFILEGWPSAGMIDDQWIQTRSLENRFFWAAGTRTIQRANGARATLLRVVVLQPPEGRSPDIGAAATRGGKKAETDNLPNVE